MRRRASSARLITPRATGSGISGLTGYGQLAAHPDGTSQVTSPDGEIIRGHAPPPRPG